jgi:hypothetical protein
MKNRDEEILDSDSDTSGEITSSSDDKDVDSNDKDGINLETIFTAKEMCYYKMINKFFRTCSNESIENMIKIINGESEISLRILDWFVTKYSKRRSECMLKKIQNTNEFFDVGRSYKAQLKSFKKRYFDPFRRRKKFRYYYNQTDKKYILTTLGQLNFFKWAFSYEIISYVEKNLEQITKSMNLSNKEEKENKKKKEDDEKKELEEAEKVPKKVKKNKKDIQIVNKGYTIKHDKIVLTFE